MSQMIINPYLFGVTQPTFAAAGAGTTSLSGTEGQIDVAYPTGIASGTPLFAHIRSNNSTSDGNIATPSGWTSVNQQSLVGAGLRSAVFWKIASGSESGTETFIENATTPTGMVGRMYRFSNGVSIEGASGAATAASATNLDAVALTTLGNLRLALQFFAASVNNTIGNITGETNADYTEAIAEYATSTPFACVLSLQVAAIPTAVAITGGSATLGASGSNRFRHTCALVP